jgi:prevent-host-death family protein
MRGFCAEECVMRRAERVSNKRKKPAKVLVISERSDDDVLDVFSINARQARTQFSRLMDIARVDRDRIVVTNHGAPAVAIIPISDLRLLRLLDETGLTKKVADKSFKTLSSNEFRTILMRTIK